MAEGSTRSAPATLVAELGDFVAGLQFAHLPPEVVEAVELRVVDVIAASATSVTMGSHHGLLKLLPGDGSSGIWGTGQSRSLRDATLINSALAHATYFEDGSRYTGGHPSSVTIPGALALALERETDGAALITAIAAGYEVFLRLGGAIYPATVRRGFQSTAILAAPAMAASAASLLALGPEATTHALAIACNHGAGLKEALKSSDSQPLQVGRSSEGGLLSAWFAAQGARGAPAILEQGFLKAFAQDADPESVRRGLGTDWLIGQTYLKAHGGCRGNHAPLDTVAELVAQAQLAVESIDQISVLVDTVTLAAAIESPRNGEQAQFSMRFSIAVLLLHGDATPVRYTDRLLNDAQVRALMDRITVSVDPALDEGYPDRRGAIVAIRTRDGRVLRHALDRAYGEPEAPYTRSDVERKFRLAAEPVYGGAASRILDHTASLHTAPSLVSLAACLRLGS